MAAAKSAGLDLGPWLDRAILDSPETGPRDQESPQWGESPIHDALTALEERIDSSHSRLAQLIDPIDDALHEMDTQVPKLLDQGQNAGNAANADLQEGPPHASPGTNDPHLATESSSDSSAGSASSANHANDDDNDDDKPNIYPPVIDTSPDISDQDIPRDFSSADEAEHSQQSDPASEWHPPARPGQGVPRIFIGIGAVTLMIGALGLLGWLWATPPTPEKWTATKLNKRVQVPPSLDQTPPKIAQIKKGASNSPAIEKTPPADISIQALRSMAEKGVPSHQYALGMALIEGKGTGKNLKGAIQWIEAAAVRGYTRAQHRLGLLHAKGTGVALNPVQAFFWHQSAADQGFADSQYRLGLLYANGEGVVKSHVLARQWFQKAAGKGHADAMFNLGRSYALGQDTPKDPQKARTWYAKAKQAGSKLVPSAPATGGTLAGTSPSTTSGILVVPKATGKIGVKEIREIQRLLASLSFNPGSADGQAGARTIEAIRLYQGFAGLAVDGQPSIALLQHIREITGSLKAP
ncbi:MAG: SEL1-like repeat protein [Rhodospirillales bacterium]|nr:SEL1-like repeat protein [Rhodospirillales bacterium]